MTRKISSFLYTIIILNATFLTGCNAKSIEEQVDLESTGSAANVILFIGNGMGAEHIRAASMYQGKPLAFEAFPYNSHINTNSANGKITDSAASATAMATGHKVNNFVLSMAIPGDQKPLKTSLQLASEQGKITGLVTTKPVFHATTAAFAANVKRRLDGAEIADYFFNKTRPTVLMGSGGMGLNAAMATKAGYTVVKNRIEMNEAINSGDIQKFLGVFGSDGLPYEWDYKISRDDGYDELPHLSEMTTAAISLLEKNEEGFFLVVEGGTIDWASHSCNISRTIYEIIEFSNAVEIAAQWAQNRDDVLIVVTSVHETGGLKVINDKKEGLFPEVQWLSGGHTGQKVPVYCRGNGAKRCLEVKDNTDIFKLTTGVAPEVVLENSEEDDEANPVYFGL